MSEQQVQPEATQAIPPDQTAPDAGTEAQVNTDSQPAQAEPPKQEPEWFVRTTAKLRKRAQEAEQEAAWLREQVSRQQPEGSEAGLTEAEVERRVQERLLRQQMEQRNTQMAEASNRTFQNGVKEFQDFEQACTIAGSHYAEEMLKRPDFFEALNDLGENAHKVYYALAKNLDELGSILDMSPAKMGLALARKERELSAAKPKPISQAPKPTTPISGGTPQTTGYREGMSMEDYVAWRKGSQAS